MEPEKGALDRVLLSPKGSFRGNNARARPKGLKLADFQYEVMNKQYLNAEVTV